MNTPPPQPVGVPARPMPKVCSLKSHSHAKSSRRNTVVVSQSGAIQGTWAWGVGVGGCVSMSLCVCVLVCVCEIVCQRLLPQVLPRPAAPAAPAAPEAAPAAAAAAARAPEAVLIPDEQQQPQQPQPDAEDEDEPAKLYVSPRRLSQLRRARHMFSFTRHRSRVQCFIGH